MSIRPLLLAFAILLGIFAAFSGRGEEAVPKWTVESLRAEIDQTRANGDLDEAAGAAVIERLESAVAQLEAKAGFEVRAEAARKEIEEGPAEVAALRAEMERRRSGVIPDSMKVEVDGPDEAGSEKGAEQLELRLATERTRVADLSRKLRAVEAELSELEDRPAEHQERLVTVTRLVGEAESKGAASTVGGETEESPRERADRILARTGLTALRAEQDALEQEALAFEIHRELVQARRDVLQSDLTLGRERVARWEDRADDLVAARIGEAEKQIADLGLQSLSSDPEVLRLVAESRELASGNQALLGRIAAADSTLAQARIELDRVRRESEDLRAQAGMGGLENAFADVVFELRGSLPSEPSLRAATERRRKEISTARLEAFRMARAIDAAASSGGQVEEWLELLRAKGVSEESLNEFRPQFTEFVANREKLRSDAVESNRRLASILGETNLVVAETVSEADALRDFIGERLVWSASSPPLGREAFTALPTAFATFFGTEAIAAYGRTLARTEGTRWMLAAVLGATLIVPRRRLRRFLAASAARCRRISIDNILNTAAAIAASLWLALPLPAGLAFLGWIFASDLSGGGKAFALGQGLMAPAPLWLVLRFASVLASRNGVAEAHFRWSRPFLDTLKRTLLALAFVYLPTHFFLVMAWAAGGDLSAFQGPGRLLFIGALIFSSLLLKRWFQSRDGLLSQIAKSPGGPHRMSRLLLAAAWILPLGLAGLAAWGHFLGAVTLADLLQKTVFVILGGVLIYGFLNRWASLKARRLALADVLAQREARRGGEESGEEDAVPKETDAIQAGEEARLAAEEEEAVDWAVVGEQTRLLIRAVVVLLALFGCWLAWSDALPALKYLDGRPLFGEVSLSDVIRLAVVVLLASLAFQNLPGVLELGFLRAVDLDPGLRNTVVTLCRYAVIALAVAFSFQALGLDWSRFGWIAAALSVGLGFGLQEVVGNFVSGLILLFERPIRVGDIVTVGGIDGVVSRIRIRATTITNWDKKEFIVPNKEFITGTILNWTLSSPVTRMVFPVGIAYGSDVERAREILLEIARAQPELLTEPAPSAVFENFGSSTLDLSLRCFVGKPEHRLELTHRINSLINERFNAAGIEMSFQHHEIHLKSVAPSIRLALEKTGEEEEKEKG